MFKTQISYKIDGRQCVNFFFFINKDLMYILEIKKKKGTNLLFMKI